MTRVPQVGAERLLRALERAGFVEVHRKGSHATLVHQSDSSRVAVVPVHGHRDVRPGTLRAILKGARLSIEQLGELL